MRTVRVIPCLDVDAGRVVKGVQFVDLFDAGDPVELAARYDRQGADELVFLDITASSDHRADHGRRGVPHRRGRLHSLHRGRWRPVGRGRPAAAAGRGRQGGGQHRGGGPARPGRRTGRRVRQPVRRGGGRRPRAGRPARATHRRGRCSPTGAGRPRVSTRSTGASRRPPSAPARSSSPPWTVTAPGTASTSARPALVADRCPVPVIASGGVGGLDHLVEGAVDGTPTPYWPRPSSTSASSPSRRPRTTSGRPAWSFAPRPLRPGENRLRTGPIPPCGSLARWPRRPPNPRRPARTVTEHRPSSPITVLADRVLVQVGQAEGERRSRAGILIPATAQVSRRLTWAQAVAVGPHVRSVKVGDNVLFNPEDRFEVEVQGDEYVILRERDIHAVAADPDRRRHGAVPLSPGPDRHRRGPERRRPATSTTTARRHGPRRGQTDDEHSDDTPGAPP